VGSPGFFIPFVFTRQEEADLDARANSEFVHLGSLLSYLLLISQRCVSLGGIVENSKYYKHVDLM
jgi:hypothetical protein